ncbi:hypothetical protein ACFV1L_20185 [Kitasatospora sp. NPDC059646]
MRLPAHVVRQRRVVAALFAVAATAAGLGAIGALWLLGTGLR